MLTRAQQAVLASSAATTAMCGVFATLVVGYHALLAAPAVAGLIAWDLMSRKVSRLLLLAGMGFGSIFGLLSRAFFWTADGLDASGFALALPYLGFVLFGGIRIYIVESRER